MSKTTAAFLGIGTIVMIILGIVYAAHHQAAPIVQDEPIIAVPAQ